MWQVRRQQHRSKPGQPPQKSVQQVQSRFKSLQRCLAVAIRCAEAAECILHLFSQLARR